MPAPKMPAPKILAFSGSLRAGSFNQKIVETAAAGARNAGAEVTVISLRDYPLPLFDQDVEAAGTPDTALQLKELFRANTGLLIASPEYNSSVTAALKNAIDWVSRPDEGKPPLDCFSGKVAGLVAASPGGLGGIRGLVHIRAILSSIKAIVVPNQAAVGAVHEKLDDDGSMTDDRSRGMVESVGADVAEMLKKLHA